MCQCPKEHRADPRRPECNGWTVHREPYKLQSKPICKQVYIFIMTLAHEGAPLCLPAVSKHNTDMRKTTIDIIIHEAFIS